MYILEPRTDCYDGESRLASMGEGTLLNGTNLQIGEPEICINNQFSKVCQDGLNVSAVVGICSNFGYFGMITV